MRAVVFRDEFYSDAESAADWYNGEQSGLGRKFLDELSRSLREVISAPESFALVDRNVRVCRLWRYAYGVYFRVTTNEIVITAVLHLHRDEAAWKSRQ